MSDLDLTSLGPRWYVAHTYSGYENKVKSSIERIVENRGYGDVIFDVQIPVEIVRTVNDKGVEKEVEQKIFPSYVLIKMVMNDETWHIVRNITGVTGFVGPGSKPVPLTEAEVEALHVERHSEELGFKVGDKVNIVSGMFEGYTGTVQEISEDKKQITVLASTGKRDIPIIVEARDVKLAE